MESNQEKRDSETKFKRKIVNLDESSIGKRRNIKINRKMWRIHMEETMGIREVYCTRSIDKKLSTIWK